MYNIEAIEGEKKWYSSDCRIPKIKKMMRIVVIKSEIWSLSKKISKRTEETVIKNILFLCVFFFFKYNLQSSETDNFISKYSDLTNCVMNIWQLETPSLASSYPSSTKIMFWASYCYNQFLMKLKDSDFSNQYLK